jgi:hypothetical protein
MDGYENVKTMFGKTSRSDGALGREQSGDSDGLPSKSLCLENSCFIKALEMENFVDSQQTDMTFATTRRVHICWPKKNLHVANMKSNISRHETSYDFELFGQQTL